MEVLIPIALLAIFALIAEVARERDLPAEEPEAEPEPAPAFDFKVEKRTPAETHLGKPVL